MVFNNSADEQINFMDGVKPNQIAAEEEEEDPIDEGTLDSLFQNPNAKEIRKAQLKQAMKQILTPEARGRLDNLRLTKPDLVQNIEIQLLQSAQAGSLRGKVTDEQLKVLLKNLMGQKREIHITRR